MTQTDFFLKNKQAQVVGSFGSAADLKNTTFETAKSACDLAEIRLDLLLTSADALPSMDWSHLAGLPLLFTARRREEGGALFLSAEKRCEMLRRVLSSAACLDIEVASIPEMGALIGELKQRGIPWIASFHDFKKLPPNAALEHALTQAKSSGAAAFKVAAQLASPADMARLAEFQLADHGILVSSMGMGPLAPVSRLLCAQAGSVLNYGFLGNTTTAPGQWDSVLLKLAISRLVSIAG